MKCKKDYTSPYTRIHGCKVSNIEIFQVTWLRRLLKKKTTESLLQKEISCKECFLKNEKKFEVLKLKESILLISKFMIKKQKS